MQYLTIKPDTEVTLATPGNLPKRVHVFDQDSIDAINAALAMCRPLLIRGEPGIGKSQLARAAAKELKRAFVPFVVDSQCESRDLLWQFDAVQRLADAQLCSAMKESADAVKARLAVDNYVYPGSLWWAYNWESAKGKLGGTEPSCEDGGDPKHGCVLLVDEIDKAEMELPNGLLEALGDGQFTPMGCKQPISASEIPPLVIITTNEERALPNAFLRRCLVLHLKLFDNNDEALSKLVRRGRAHFENLDEDILRMAAEILLNERAEQQAQQLQPLPGQAEYLDLLRAVNNRAPNEKSKQTTLLKEVKRFVVNKQAVISG